MIVTPQGLNVFPEDVERALVAQPGIRDACVVGLRTEGEERIHAVLVADPGADVRAAVREANATLEDHQRVWSTSIWPGEVLPRTEGTQKLKRREVQRWAAGEAGAGPARTGGTTVEDLVGRFAGGRVLEPTTTLGELGLSSLDRVELMMALEDAFQTTLEESALGEGRTIAEIKSLVGGGGAQPEATPAPAASRAAAADVNQPAGESIRFPSWNRSAIAWFIRRISLPTWILPLARIFMKMTVRGLEHLRELEGPVVFAATHQSPMDTPAIFIALPSRWRYRVAPAMSKEFFRAHFFPAGVPRRKRVMNSIWYYLACQFFNAFPLPQREAGTRQTLRYIGEVLADGYSVLIFPEGRRSDDGALQPFRPGIGMIGSRLDVPVIPVRIIGLTQVLHPKMKWPRRGPVTVAFGAPLRLAGDDYPALARQVHDAVARLG
jgi:long-chain acyl-CoA synthetase